MIRRVANRLLDAQTWADDVGEFLQRIVLALLRPIPPIKDFLHGTWLGHSLHAVVTDVAVGALTVGLVLDVAGVYGDPVYLPGADLATLVGVLGMFASVLTGLADHSGTDGRARRYATLHFLVMFVAAVFYLLSSAVRFDLIAGSAPQALTLSAVGFVLITVGAYIGGEIVYGLGWQVDRHAWRSGGAKWTALEPAEFAEGAPVKARAGAQTVVVVRRGEDLHVLHDTCAHAGCSLAENGKLVGDDLECQCHGSRYDLRTGRVSRGPSTWDQPAYDVRREEGKVEVRRRTRSQ